MNPWDKPMVRLRLDDLREMSALDLGMMGDAVELVDGDVGPPLAVLVPAKVYLRWVGLLDHLDDKIGELSRRVLPKGPNP
jgi:hypothetical protein